VTIVGHEGEIRGVVWLDPAVPDAAQYLLERLNLHLAMLPQ
jgi:hypothetical protein